MKVFHVLLALLRRDKSVGGSLHMAAHTACGAVKVVARSARGMLCMRDEVGHGGSMAVNGAIQTQSEESDGRR